MTTETLKQKAKRILKNFDFSKDNHCISLVGPDLGGAANGYEVLAMKALNPQEQTIELSKALEQVSLTISMEEFLRKFFDMWSSDAEVLTKLLGFETEHEAYMKERESQSDEYDWAAEHEKWISERVSQFTLMKSMNEGSVTEISKSAFDEIVALQQKHETALIEHINTKVKQMEELDLAKSALTAKEAELATQVELVKSLEGKVAELEQSLSVFKAAQEKAEFDAFAAQLKDVVAEDKLEQVAKGLYALHKVDAEAAATSIEAMKAAKMAATVVADGLTEEQSHPEVVNAEEAELAKAAEQVQKAYKKLAKSK